MSGGFTEQQKEEIRKKLINKGTELAGEIGFKKMTIAAITKEANVAVGSFYNFFDSKESFAVALINDMEEKSLADFMALLTKQGTIPAKEFLEWYRDFFRPENNFLLRLKLDDWVWLKTHITDGTYLDNNADMRRITDIQQYITGVRKDFNPAVVVNFVKSIYTIYQNRETFFEKEIQTNVDLIFDAIYHYVKEDNQK